MPKPRPPTSGYARIAQDEEQPGRGYLDDSDDDDPHQRPSTLSTSASRYAPIQPQQPPSMRASGLTSPTDLARLAAGRRRLRSNSSGVDIKAINARLERWAEEIASKFKISKVKGKTEEEEQLEIHHSVFQAPEGTRPAPAETLDLEAGGAGDDGMSQAGFDEIVESVRVAIEMGVHPSMISQGSSGSYFARNSEGTIVGVFKPKDEEPYASRNPKWTKWLHRNLFPCFFGRACLIPNLSYVSEAAAYVLDERLQTGLVPRTEIVHLSSKSFFYDYWDRRSYYRKRKPFPQKVGSFQVFLKGFKDANVFLREHPWPDQQNAGFRTEAAPRRKRRPWDDPCRPRGAPSDEEDEVEDERERVQPATEPETEQRRFFWTDALRQSFREELEKLVILDYIMRNTDRGLDNWMIKVDWAAQKVSVTSEPVRTRGDGAGEAEDDDPRPARPVQVGSDEIGLSDLAQPSPYKLQQPMDATSRSATPVGGPAGPTISIGAIDNSLSWPWKHPDAWRSFPFGWLFLPVSLIGQPFSQKTRDHFLPLLVSKKWWSGTQLALRRVFSRDSDFKEKMFARQMAVMKGQAWNVVETLKTADHGPLELTRRTRVCVWDDLVDIPVAVPLRVPSSEMRRRRDLDLQQGIDEEEMDISAANGSTAAPQHDLLGLGGPAAEMPSPNRFNMSRSVSTIEDSPTPEERDGAEASTVPSTNRSIDQLRKGLSDPALARKAAGPARPAPPRSRTRVSLDGTLRPTARAAPSRRRGHSFSARGGSGSSAHEGDDLEGDLGYAAAEGREKNQRKVIVERLETVKSKHPVFTWC
ncbi:MAG: phosphatidyl inositol kinase [Thelocarpon impressellum]|nr:MAG: phosphatidyl inositol kinase [Thelocarpon impressellum]